MAQFLRNTGRRSRQDREDSGTSHVSNHIMNSNVRKAEISTTSQLSLHDPVAIAASHQPVHAGIVLALPQDKGEAAALDYPDFVTGLRNRRQVGKLAPLSD